METLFYILCKLIYLLINAICFMIIWNLTIPVIFGNYTINYISSLGLLILYDLLTTKPIIKINSDENSSN